MACSAVLHSGISLECAEGRAGAKTQLQNERLKNEDISESH